MLVYVLVVLLAVAVVAMAIPAAHGPTPWQKLRAALIDGRSAEAEALLVRAPKLAVARDTRGATLLHDAPNASAVRLLTARGADPNAPNAAGATPLHSVDGEETFLALLDAGADGKAITRNGTPALHHAAQRGWAQAVNRLLESGLAVDLRDSAGNTPLHRVPPHHREMVDLLLAHGADPRAQNARGETPLHIAVSWVPAGKIKQELRELSPGAGAATVDRWFGGIRSLVEAGADLSARDDKGDTPLTRARERGAHAEVVAYLEGPALPA
jgi:ankyrin repeat protein